MTHDVSQGGVEYKGFSPKNQVHFLFNLAMIYFVCANDIDKVSFIKNRNTVDKAHSKKVPKFTIAQLTTLGNKPSII